MNENIIAIIICIAALLTIPLPILPILIWVIIVDHIRPPIRKFFIWLLPRYLHQTFFIEEWEYYTKTIDHKHIKGIKIQCRKSKYTGEVQHLQILTGRWI